MTVQGPPRGRAVVQAVLRGRAGPILCCGRHTWLPVGPCVRCLAVSLGGASRTRHSPARGVRSSARRARTHAEHRNADTLSLPIGGGKLSRRVRFTSWGHREETRLPLLGGRRQPRRPGLGERALGPGGTPCRLDRLVPLPPPEVTRPTCRQLGGHPGARLQCALRATGQVQGAARSGAEAGETACGDAQAGAPQPAPGSRCVAGVTEAQVPGWE